MNDKKYIWPLICYGGNLYFNTYETLFFGGLKVAEHFKPEISKSDFSKISKGIGTLLYGVPAITYFANFVNHTNFESFLLAIANGMMTFELGKSFIKSYDKGDFDRWKNFVSGKIQNFKSKNSGLEGKL